MRVLVAEDEPRMAGLLKRALQEEGYAVDVAVDGRGDVRLCLGSWAGHKLQAAAAGVTGM